MNSKAKRTIMEKQTFIVRTWYRDTKDGVMERPTTFKYYLNGGYSPSMTNLLYKIYGDVYHQMREYGYNWEKENYMSVTITPEGDGEYISPSLIRYCQVVKSWLDFIEFPA